MELKDFAKRKDYLVCVDSDGCAMDTMDIKHFKCFGPCMVDEWGLKAFEEQILTRWNEINLYSLTRGINRFKGLALALSEINERFTKIDGIEILCEWAESAKELSNGALEREITQKNATVLKKALSWSKAVNAKINALPEEDKRAYEGVKEALTFAHGFCDIAVVSSANLDAVIEEWEKRELLRCVDIVLAQNAGSKAYCISELLKKGYDRDKVLMCGDAPGDLDASVKNGVSFFPILVKKEKESWLEFTREGVLRLCKGQYAGEYQEKKKREFFENLSK